MFMFIAIYFFQKGCFNAGCLLFSIALGYKANVLLYAPGIFYIIALKHGFLSSILYSFGLLSMQMLIGAEFLIYDLRSYCVRGFNLPRKFSLKNSRNLKWIGEQNRPFYKTDLYFFVLMITILSSLAYIAIRRWTPLLDPNHKVNIRNVMRQISFWPFKI